MKQTIKKLFFTHQRLIISLFIFALVFCLLGLPYTDWWFRGRDDFHGLYLGYKTKTWNDLFYFFINGDTNQGLGPSNAPPATPMNFFNVFYRPLYCIYFALQFWFFNTWAYPYLLCNVFFHALNTVILFNIFSWLIPLFPALLTSLLFAFHPGIAYRFGDIVNLHFYVNVTLTLLIMLAFKKYLDSEKIIFYLLACFLFIFSLFTRESTIVLPAILFGGAFLSWRPYPSRLRPGGFGEASERFFEAIKVTLGFWLILIAFFALRMYLYPVVFSSSSTPLMPLLKNFIVKKLAVIIMIINDAFGTSCLAWGQKLAKGLITIGLAGSLFWLFINNRKKIWIIYFLTCAMLMLWPAFLCCYHQRYFYEAHPFFLFAFVLCFKYYDHSLILVKKIGLPLLSLLIIFYITLTVQSFKRREKKLHTLKQATYELIKNPLIKNRALCFLGYPLDGCGDQNPQIYWILFNDPSITIYFDQATALTQGDSDTFLITRWYNAIPIYHYENYFTIKKTGSHVRFTSLDTHKIQFAPAGDFSLGEKIIHQTKMIKGENVITDFTLIIDEKYMKQDPVFLSWDYPTKQFVFIKDTAAD